MLKIHSEIAVITVCFLLARTISERQSQCMGGSHRFPCQQRFSAKKFRNLFPFTRFQLSCGFFLCQKKSFLSRAFPFCFWSSSTPLAWDSAAASWQTVYCHLPGTQLHGQVSTSQRGEGNCDMKLESDIGVWSSSPLGCPRPTARGSETWMEPQMNSYTREQPQGTLWNIPDVHSPDPSMVEAPARIYQKSLKHWFGTFNFKLHF